MAFAVCISNPYIRFIDEIKVSPERCMDFHFECDRKSYVVERQIVDGQIWVKVSLGLKTQKIKHAS